jgi:hypothetical protein
VGSEGGEVGSAGGRVIGTIVTGTTVTGAGVGVRVGTVGFWARTSHAAGHDDSQANSTRVMVTITCERVGLGMLLPLMGEDISFVMRERAPPVRLCRQPGDEQQQNCACCSAYAARDTRGGGRHVRVGR